MADKEQMIIDGCNVSGCRYYLHNLYKSCGEGLVDCEGKDCIFKQLKRKEQECEELKAYAQRQENQREEYYKEFLKKDKALEEIEKVCLEDTYTFADGTQVRYDSLNDILDIINKLKGE